MPAPSFNITTPAGTDRYSLTSDLLIMASDTSDHLRSVWDEYVDCVRPNTSVQFLTITTTSAPTFNTGINITGPKLNAAVVNNATLGFGLRGHNSARFTTYDGQKWVSTGAIDVPTGGSGKNAVNHEELTALKNDLQDSIANLTSRVTATENSIQTLVQNDSNLGTQLQNLTKTASDLNSKIDATNIVVASKADSYQYSYKVKNAQNSEYAVWTDSAVRAGDCDSVQGKRFATGSFYAGSLRGSDYGAASEDEEPITHNLGVRPVVIAQAYNDDGESSITCSIGEITNTTAIIKYKNRNNKASEQFRINWVAIAG